MLNKCKKGIAVLLCMIWIAGSGMETQASVNVSSPSSILIEASTGQVIYEANADEKRSPASITKIMTLLITFERIEKGDIKLTDQVITSEYASSMGGSQVFLAANEVQTLDTMIKCIAVSSGNDASVAVAEFIAGSEESFVGLMNQKALELGMTNTHFEDCCGLTDSDNHYTTARDIALMSRELITKYPAVYNYTQIWMEDITHTTANGSSTFTLSSTNKLLKQYEGATGLKTGSTSKALYCLSATANRNDIDLIAVVLAAPESQGRFKDAMNLLNYGFSVSSLYIDENQEELPLLPVLNGVEEEVPLAYGGEFRYLDIVGNSLDKVVKEIRLPESIQAPVKQGTAVGEAVYFLNGEEIGSVSILFTKDVEKAVYKDYLLKIIEFFLL
ncbi:D-alanyl-D-alanine carboxypeptidase [Lachnospiraceae bacterium OttesenSCG-928-D06]|nr:D-alanyl-D-alanine carboxypeptidase [Lachnospiraceae bacterium OttesenSCG-928-D06]